MSIARGVRYLAAACTVALAVLSVLTFVHICADEGLTLSIATAFQKEESISDDMLRNRRQRKHSQLDKKQQKSGFIESEKTAPCSVHVPSPEKYLMGIAAHTAARRSIAVPLGKESRQEELVSRAVFRMFGKVGERAMEKNWEVFLLSHPYRTSSLVHALMTEISPRFRLSDSHYTEIQGIVEEEIERRRKSLVEVRRKWPCTASRVWFEKHCVKPGVFYTWEFVERHLLSGFPHEDSKNDEVFYKTWIYAFDLPAYIRPLTMFVNRCCEDMWCDLDVVNGIAELMGSHVLKKQVMSVTGYGACEDITVPSQESVDLICGKMTRIYMDAILRRIDLDVLFDAVQPRCYMPAGSSAH